MINIYLRLLFLALSISCSSAFAQNILIQESFDDDMLPEGWSQQTQSSDGGWLNGDNSTLQSEWWEIEFHGDFIATNDDESDCDKSADYLILPAFNLENIDGLLLSFASFFSGESFQGDTEYVTIEYSLDGGES